MRILLDTHVLLWWLAEDSRLGAAARDLIDRGDQVLVSQVSLWEIVIKIRIGKLAADFGEIEREVERAAFVRLPIEPDHLRALVGLPARHRDPFDHLLIAQAIAEQAAFLTADRDAAAYPVETIAP